ncbi:hypothetical protein [Alsobacter sp. SYSU BS001988]
MTRTSTLQIRTPRRPRTPPRRPPLDALMAADDAVARAVASASTDCGPAPPPALTPADLGGARSGPVPLPHRRRAWPAVLALAALGAGALVWSGSDRAAAPNADDPAEPGDAARAGAAARRSFDLVTALVDPAAASAEERRSLDEAFRIGDGVLTLTGRCGETTAMPLAAAAQSWRISCGRRGVSVEFGGSEDAAALRLASAAQSPEACRALTPRVTAALGRALDSPTSAEPASSARRIRPAASEPPD